MSPTVKVKVDPVTLTTSIVFDHLNNKTINELRLILGSVSENMVMQENKIELPWNSFKIALIQIGFVLKNENVQFLIDAFGQMLIEQYIDDRESLSENKKNIIIPANEINLHLSKLGFDRKLTIQQLRDTSKLLSLKNGANFSVPGAGKTATILAVHTLLKQKKIVDTLFVISPINAYISWEDEIKDIFKRKPLSVLRLKSNIINNFQEAVKSNPDVLLINYEKMRREIQDFIPWFQTKKIHLVLDESHRIKGGFKNLSYTQILQLADISHRRDILSGTPMPQSYEDLIPQFNFLWSNQEIIPDVSEESEEVKIKKINISIKNLFVRTTKKELGLKNPKISMIPIKMGPIQKDLYQLFKSETARVIAGMDINNKSNFRRIGRSVIKLLQASTNPMLLSSDDNYDEDILPIPINTQVWQLLEEFVKYEKPEKIEYLKKRVNDITSKNRSNKIVIWSSFVRNIRLLERIFKEYNPVSIYGGIPTGSDEDETFREGRIRKFHEDKTCRLIIANPQACGEGISLHKVCHNAIYLDRTFNAAHYLQSIDRIHRLGLDNKIETNVEILISKDSIDEILISRLNEKIKRMGSILDDPYLKTLAYDPADIPIDEEEGIDLKDFEDIKRHVLLV